MNNPIQLLQMVNQLKSNPMSFLANMGVPNGMTNDPQKIIQNLMNREQREKVSEEDAAYIGITGENVDASVSQLYGLPIGIYLSEVSENSPASDAGMTKGMVMTAFDGISVETMSDLQDLLQYYAAGETVTVTVQKADDNGEVVESELSLTLGRRSDYIKLN